MYSFTFLQIILIRGLYNDNKVYTNEKSFP